MQNQAKLYTVLCNVTRFAKNIFVSEIDEYNHKYNVQNRKARVWKKYMHCVM
jgi:hypothetical protein